MRVLLYHKTISPGRLSRKVYICKIRRFPCKKGASCVFMNESGLCRLSSRVRFAFPQADRKRGYSSSYFPYLRGWIGAEDIRAPFPSICSCLREETGIKDMRPSFPRTSYAFMRKSEPSVFRRPSMHAFSCALRVNSSPILILYNLKYYILFFIIFFIFFYKRPYYELLFTVLPGVPPSRGHVAPARAGPPFPYCQAESDARRARPSAFSPR